MHLQAGTHDYEGQYQQPPQRRVARGVQHSGCDDPGHEAEGCELVGHATSVGHQEANHNG